MKQAWFVRPNIGEDTFVNQFRENNLIAFDVRNTNSLSIDEFKAEPNFEEKTPEELRSLLSQAPYNFDNNIAGNWVPLIDIFVNRMAIDDLVLVPLESTIFFACITSACRYEKRKVRNFLSDNPAVKMTFPPKYQRSVKWLGQVTRKELSGELRSALKNRRVLGELSKFYDEIDALSCGQQYTPKRETISVRYPLRPNFEVTYAVPCDMTSSEAEKLSEHFKTIYFRETGSVPSKERTFVALDKYIEDQSMERRKTLLYRLVRNGKLTVADAAEAIDVSPETFKETMELYDSAHAVIGQSESEA